MQYTWEIDEGNIVVAERGFLRAVVRLNGEPVFKSWRMPRQVVVPLTGGREAVVTFRVEMLTFVRVELLLDGQRMVPTGEFSQRQCAKCQARVNPNEKFCEQCGNPLPGIAEFDRKRMVKDASGAITVVAVLFAIAGVVMFAIQWNAAQPAMENLATFEDAAVWSEPVDGQQLTVAELRKQIQFETWSVLVINVFLALTMWGLSRWAKVSPLPALISAAAIYLVVIVTNAIADPATITQGLLMKVAIVIILMKGIRSATELSQAGGAVGT